MAHPLRPLVIGGTGLVGGALLRALSRAGMTATCAYHSRPISGGLELDVRDRISVKNCFDMANPDLVFLAVNIPGGVDFCEKHPEEARAINVDATGYIAEAAAANNTTLVYYSTDYVFDGRNGPYSEEDHTGPINVYGQTKLEAERLIGDSSPNCLIIRTTTVFGWDLHSPNFAMQIWKRLSAGQTMKVPDDQWSNPTLADYLAETSVELSISGIRGTINVVGNDRTPRSHLGKVLACSMKLDPDLIAPVSTSELKPLAQRPLAAGLTSAKLQQITGRTPIGLDVALKRFCSHMKATGG